MYVEWLKDWALVIGAVAAIVLATAAFFTIRNSNRQYKRLKDERLVNEIIEWAIDCAKYAIKLNHGEVVKVEGRTPTYLLSDNSGAKFVTWQKDAEQVETLQTLRARSAYIEHIVPNTASRLATIVSKLTCSLQAKLTYIHDPNLVEKWEKAAISGAEEAYELNLDVYKNAVDVSSEAARFKSTT